MARKESPNKRRGRPLSSSPPGDDGAVVKARRERNREAQNTFRKRKQAAEAQQTRRLQRLEEVVEEMSSVYMSFVDELLQRDAVKMDAELMGCLRKTTEKVHGLACEVVGPEDLSVTTRPLVIEEEERVEEMDLIMPDLTFSSSSSNDSPPSYGPLQLTLTDQYQKQQSYTPPDDPPTSPRLQPPSFDPLSISSDILLPPQIYGNGWTFRPAPLPPHPNPTPQDLQALSWGAQPLAPDSFAFRLTKTALTFAYLLLSRSPDSPIPLSEENRIFRSTFRYRTREDMLVRMRWVLGPGIRELWRVADMPFGRWGDVVISRDDLQTGLGESQPDVVTDSDLLRETSRFMSVAGVEKQLIALGAKIVNSETLELSIANSSQPSESSDTMSTQPDSWSFVNFFSAEKPRKATALNMKLSIASLVHSLSTTAVCLMRGPGFSRFELGRAIEASIITAVGGQIAV